MIFQHLVKILYLRRQNFEMDSKTRILDETNSTMFSKFRYQIVFEILLVKDYDFILNQIFVLKICNVAEIKQIKLLTEKKKLAC